MNSDNRGVFQEIEMHKTEVILINRLPTKENAQQLTNTLLM